MIPQSCFWVIFQENENRILWNHIISDHINKLYLQMANNYRLKYLICKRITVDLHLSENHAKI